MNLERTPIKEFVNAKEITAISKVRANVNGYPFLTFIDAKGDAENFYFSKNASAKVEIGQTPADISIDTMNLVETANADGELRLKLSYGSDDYTNVSDLF